MKDFAIHTQSTAPEGAKPQLGALKEKLGFVPNLLATSAEAPLALGTYLTLLQTMEKTSFSGAEREVIFLATSVKNGCGYCVASHSLSSKRQGLPAEVIEALRAGKPIADPKLETLRQFAEGVIESKGAVSEELAAKFLGAGYSRTQALEAVLGVITKTFSNYAHALTEAPLDPAFKSAEWSPGAG